MGATAAGTVLSVTDNQLAVDSALPLDAAQLVKPGMRVAIDEQALGIKASGVVSMVAATPGTRGADGFHVYFETRVDKTTLQLDRVSVRLTIPISPRRVPSPPFLSRRVPWPPTAHRAFKSRIKASLNMCP